MRPIVLGHKPKGLLRPCRSRVPAHVDSKPFCRSSRAVRERRVLWGNRTKCPGKNDHWENKQLSLCIKDIIVRGITTAKPLSDSKSGRFLSKHILQTATTKDQGRAVTTCHHYQESSSISFRTVDATGPWFSHKATIALLMFEEIGRIHVIG